MVFEIHPQVVKEILGGASHLYELADVAQSGGQVALLSDKAVLRYHADGQYAGKWTADPLQDFATVEMLEEAISHASFECIIASHLPSPSENTRGKLYFIPKENVETRDVYEEYVTLLKNGQYSWERVGGATIDLRDYAKTADMEAAIAAAKAFLQQEDLYIKQYVDALTEDIVEDVEANVAVLNNRINEAQGHLAEVRDDLAQVRSDLADSKAAVLEDISRVQSDLADTREFLEGTKDDLLDIRAELLEKGLTIDYVVGRVDTELETIETSIRKIQDGSDYEMTTWIGQIIDAKAGEIETAYKSYVESTTAGFAETTWVGQLIEGTEGRITTAYMNYTDDKVADKATTTWVGQMIDGKAGEIETAYKQYTEDRTAGLAETTWVGQYIEGVEGRITTAYEHYIEDATSGFAETTWVGQQIDGVEGRITTAYQHYVDDATNGFASSVWVGQLIDGVEGRIETAYKSYVDDATNGLATTTWVGQEIDGLAGTIETAYKSYVDDATNGLATTVWVGQEIDGMAQSIKTGIETEIYGEGYTETKTIGQIIDGMKEEISNYVLHSQDFEDFTTGITTRQISGAYTNWGIDYITSFVSQVTGILTEDGELIDVVSKFSEINQSINNIKLVVGESSEYGGDTILDRFAAIDINIDQIATTVRNGDNYAEIIARVNEDGSIVTIRADKIALLGETVAEQLTALSATIGNLYLTNATVEGTIQCVIDGETYWILSPDGSGELAKGNIVWDNSGNLIINGTLYSSAGVIGGWTIDENRLYSTVAVSGTAGAGYTTLALDPLEGINSSTTITTAGERPAGTYTHFALDADGSGSISNGAISWDGYGAVSIGQNVIISGMTQSLSEVITNLTSLVTEIHSWFELDANGDIKTCSFTDQHSVVRARGFYSENFVAAGGTSSHGGGGTGGGADTIKFGSYSYTVDSGTTIINVPVSGTNSVKIPLGITSLETRVGNIEDDYLTKEEADDTYATKDEIKDGDKNYVHTQGVASDTWIIVHNLNKYPSVTLSINGHECFADVEFIDTNNVKVHLASAASGVAYCN